MIKGSIKQEETTRYQDTQLGETNINGFKRGNGLKENNIQKYQWTDRQTETQQRSSRAHPVIKQMNLIDVYRAFHPADTEYTFFFRIITKSSSGLLKLQAQNKTQQIKKMKITTCFFSDWHGMKLETKNSKYPRGYVNCQKMNSKLVNEQWIIEEMKKKMLETN